MQKNGLQIKILLKDVKPEIWRRFIVPASMDLETFHYMIQIVMGWDDYHPHLFSKGKEKYLIPDEEEELAKDEFDEAEYTVGQLLVKEGDEIGYLYDFGDNWDHVMTLEEIVEDYSGEPVCLDGQRACPPEEIGGVQGYQKFLEVLKNPELDKENEFEDWIEEDFDPGEFDLELVNEMLEG